VKIDYNPKKLGKTFADEKAMLKAYGDRAKKVIQRKRELAAAENLDVIAKIPAANLHPLKGNRNGDWAIDVFKNWRICFEIAHNPLPTISDGGIDFARVTDITIVSVEDYH
jgi:proteic killer suppression protein